MPPPRLSAAADAMPLSIFARLYEKVAGFPGDVITLQIGDTHMGPPAASRLERLGYEAATDREIYHYGPAAGWGPLVERLAAKVSTSNQIPVGTSGVQISSGATHALWCALGAVCDPGDEILLLAPHWPLIRGIALSRNLVPVEVPFTQVLRGGGGGDPLALLEAKVTPRTRAVYVCTPNNPDGAVLRESELRAVAEVAERHGLWILSDEVYEDYVYEGRHRSIAALPGVAERTLTVFSFSKGYAQAGLRVGYAAGPVAAIGAMRKMVNHTVYNVPHALQRAALAAIDGGAEFLGAARARYRAARDHALAQIKAPCAVPDGSTYLFLDLRGWSPDGDCQPVLERFAEAGVLLAPGVAFGSQFGGFARLCFTAVDEARLEDGVARINRVLAG
jgi:aspartate/methionine/tyrosine aminotransferase